MSYCLAAPGDPWHGPYHDTEYGFPIAADDRLFDIGATDPGAGEYCDHLDGLRELALSRSIAAWAAIADVTSAQIERLAEAYADGPSAILVGWGMQRRIRGAATVRVLDALGAVSGNLGVPGASRTCARATAASKAGSTPTTRCPRRTGSSCSGRPSSSPAARSPASS